MANNDGTSVLEDPRTIAERTFELLKTDIISGSLAQGSKIIEEDLARKYGISRGPLREAIRRLEGIKLVQRIPRAGVRVVRLDQRMMADVYQIREALEGMSARLAAQQMSQEKIDDLWVLLDVHQQGIEEAEGKAYFQREGNLDFHYRIAVASGNQWLIHYLYRELYQLFRMCRHQSAQLPERPAAALDEHRQIVKAIAHRDGELAEMLMRRHIAGSWQAVQDLLPAASTSPSGGTA